MKLISKTLLISISVSIGFITFAKSPDPLQLILDRLGGIEDRLTQLEKVKNKPASKITSTKLPANTKNSKTKSAKPINSDNYTKGMVVELKPAKKGMPMIGSFGAFVWDLQDPISKSLLSEEKIKYSDKPGTQFSGYLKVEESGVHTFKVSLKFRKIPEGHDTRIQAFIEDNLIIDHKGLQDTYSKTDHHIIGAAELEPGIYKLKVWIQSSSKYPAQTHFEIKTPNSLNFINPKNMIYYKKK